MFRDAYEELDNAEMAPSENGAIDQSERKLPQSKPPVI
jgi:hypothetical protein